MLGNHYFITITNLATTIIHNKLGLGLPFAFGRIALGPLCSSMCLHEKAEAGSLAANTSWNGNRRQQRTVTDADEV